MPRARAGLREVSPPNGTPAPRARPADSGAEAQQLLEETETLPAVQRERLTRQLRSALAAQAQIRKQSGRLPRQEARPL